MKRTDRSLRLWNEGELYDTTPLRARALVQDLGELDLAGGLEELDQVLVRSGPRQLLRERQYALSNCSWRSTHVADHDLLRRFGLKGGTSGSSTIRSGSAACGIRTGVAVCAQAQAALRVRPRIVCVQVLAGEIATACSSTESAPEATAEATTTEATTKTSAQATANTATVRAWTSQAGVSVLANLKRAAVPVEAIVHA